MTAADGSLADESPTVLDLIGRSIEETNRRAEVGQIAKRTAQTRLFLLKPFALWIHEQAPGLTADKLKPHHFSEWLNSRKGWGATARHDAVADLKRVFNWATAEGHIDRNPIAIMSEPKGGPRDHVVEREEYRALFEASGGSKFAGRHCRAFRPVLLALWLTGSRPSEVRRVRVQDFDGWKWKIANHKTRKKEKQPRNVYLSPCAATLARIAARGRMSGPLFEPLAGERWTYEKMKQRF